MKDHQPLPEAPEQKRTKQEVSEEAILSQKKEDSEEAHLGRKKEAIPRLKKEESKEVKLSRKKEDLEEAHLERKKEATLSQKVVSEEAQPRRMKHQQLVVVALVLSETPIKLVKNDYKIIISQH